MIAAAFMVMRSPEGKVLLLRRAQGEDFPGRWDLPGGKIKAGESAEQAVIREVLEETAYRTGHAGKWLCRRVKDQVDAVTYLFNCDSEFVPKLNKEHDLFLWCSPEQALTMGGVAP
jgi:8-oxo-dGTP pyrophosphatase MutT (NUDIX family)